MDQQAAVGKQGQVDAGWIGQLAADKPWGPADGSEVLPSLGENGQVNRPG